MTYDCIHIMANEVSLNVNDSTSRYSDVVVADNARVHMGDVIHHHQNIVSAGSDLDKWRSGMCRALSRA